MSDKIDDLNRRATAYQEACDRVRAAYDSLIDAYTVPGVALPGVLDAAERVLSVLDNATFAAERVLKLRDELLKPVEPTEPTVPAAKIRELAEWHEAVGKRARNNTGLVPSGQTLQIVHNEAAGRLRELLNDDQDDGDA